MDNFGRIIVFEDEPYWQPELQRRFLGEDVGVVACRSIRDLEKRLLSDPPHVIILDLAADVGESLRWLARCERQSASLSVIVVAAAEYASLEWYLRELGATAVVDEFSGGQQMAAVCRKSWQHIRPIHSGSD